MPKYLNDQGQGIEWTDYTWNPITGCLNDCPWCYARAMAHRFGWSFVPEFHPKRLEIGNVASDFQSKNPNLPPGSAMIFVCSVSEICGPWVPMAWVWEILEVVKANPQHIFQVLTKNPKALLSYRWPENAWVGASATDAQSLYHAYDVLAALWASRRFISFEPLLSRIKANELEKWLVPADWVIIGHQTGRGKKKPLADVQQWATEIMKFADSYGIPVLLKDSLGMEMRREWPRKGVTP